MNNRWRPNTTVAAVVEMEGRFLIVEERDPISGARVFNQPAGHLEAGEGLIAATQREVLEETRWQIEVQGYLGVAVFEAANGITYLRHTFSGKPLAEDRGRTLDAGIIGAHWMDMAAIESCVEAHRSHLVLEVLKRYRAGAVAPLSLVIDP